MFGIDLDQADHGLPDDLRIVATAAARGLSQLVLRTDIAGMPLEWIDYKEAARLYHQRACRARHIACVESEPAADATFA